MMLEERVLSQVFLLNTQGCSCRASALAGICPPGSVWLMEMHTEFSWPQLLKEKPAQFCTSFFHLCLSVLIALLSVCCDPALLFTVRSGFFSFPLVWTYANLISSSPFMLLHSSPPLVYNKSSPWSVCVADQSKYSPFGIFLSQNKPDFAPESDDVDPC